MITGLEHLLPGDSLDYHVLYNATRHIRDVPGVVCEIGTRRGGSLRYIIDAITDSIPTEHRHVVAVDPYGNIMYAASDTFTGRLDYTNNMKNEAMANIYQYVRNKPVNLVFINLEDTEFFSRYSEGVPVYLEQKRIINQYALVFFDGPHDEESVMKEVTFFDSRLSSGGAFVFDDIQTYNHDRVHNYLLQSGFVVKEIGQQGRKISYTRSIYS